VNSIGNLAVLDATFDTIGNNSHHLAIHFAHNNSTLPEGDGARRTFCPSKIGKFGQFKIHRFIDLMDNLKIYYLIMLILFSHTIIGKIISIVFNKRKLFYKYLQLLIATSGVHCTIVKHLPGRTIHDTSLFGQGSTEERPD
jgi:hypothetical protein